ncbi:MAG: DUF4407 domain-containing protein [Saprospiraceae bacterium]|nr:DUF4407 domain-containing protein [Saprospiraceae bacterium]
MDENQFSSSEKFLWWLASADSELLDGNRAEQRKFSLIGLSILFTWLFATAIWMYFFSTVVNDVFLILIGGILMGLIVLTIDRVLIAGMQGSAQVNKSGAIFFRVTLALCLGAFMAQPALLYLFKKDIEIQLTFDQEVKKQATVAEIKRALKPQTEPLVNRRDSLAKIASALDSQVIALRNSYLAEADGSGGTGKVGIATIARAKKAEYDAAVASKSQWLASASPQLKNINAQLDTLSKIENQRIAAFDALSGDGFLARIEALQHLIEQNPALRWRYILLLSIIMLIELAPILSKLLLNTKVYNQRLVLEEGYLLNLDREVFEKKYNEAKKYADSIHQTNMEAIDRIFEESKEAIRHSSQNNIRNYELHHQRPANVSELLAHMRKNMMGRHT